MSASKRRTSSLVAMLVLASLAIPGAAKAAPLTIDSLVVYGDKLPSSPDFNDPFPGSNPVHTKGQALFANSQPHRPAGSEGDVYYFGHTDPGVLVEITVTDGANTITTRTTSAPATADPLEDGYGPGDFGYGVPNGAPPSQYSNGVDHANAIKVTDLGVHVAPGLPTSLDPNDWGRSDLTLTFKAVDPNTNAQGPSVARQIVKYAGTPNDTTAPKLSQLKFPPTHWCHFTATGAKDPIFGQHLGGTTDGQCSSFAQAPLGAIPDITWLICLYETSEPHRWLLDPTLPANPFRGNYCRTNYSNSIPRGESGVSGKANDIDQFNIGSEIASVTLDITRGGTPYLPTITLVSPTNAPSVNGGRWGFGANFGRTLKLADFEPNWPNGQAYKFTITVKDAFGRTATAASSDTWVYPY